MPTFTFPTNPNPLRLFLSYSSENKAIAGQIKTYLENKFCFNVFVAHDDLTPTKEWQDEIIAQLEICDSLIAIVTNEFNISDWTDQEIGFALSRKIPIIAVNFGDVPHGFIAKFQALPSRKIRENWDIQGLCFDIFRLLTAKPDIKEKIFDGIIFKYGQSISFSEADDNTSFVMNFSDQYSFAQKNKIIELASENSQIYLCFACRRMLDNFIIAQRDELNPESIEKYREKVERGF